MTFAKATALAAIGFSILVTCCATAQGGGGVSLTETDMKLTGEAARLARVGQTPSTCILDVRRQGSGRHKQIVKDFEAAPQDPVILFGDSLTDNWRGKRFDYMRESFSAVNAGICGDRVEDVLWRLTDMLPALKAKPPKVLSFMIGTNNLNMNSSAEDIFEGVRKLVGIVRENCPSTKIIVFAIPPRGVSHNTYALPFPEPVNRLLRGLADGEHVFFFDFSALLVDKHNAYIMPEFYENDRLHFSDKGYAEVLTPYIAGAIRLVCAKNLPAGYTARLDLWRDYIEKRLDMARRNNALEELWREEYLLRDLMSSMLNEFAELEKDPDHVPQMPPEFIRQDKEEGLPKELK